MSKIHQRNIVKTFGEIMEQRTLERTPVSPVVRFRLARHIQTKGEKDLTTVSELKDKLPKEKAEELLKQGKRPGQLARIFNTSPRAIGILLEEYGLSIKVKTAPRRPAPQSKLQGSALESNKKSALTLTNDGLSIRFNRENAGMNEVVDILDSLLSFCHTAPAKRFKVSIDVTELIEREEEENA